MNTEELVYAFKNDYEIECLKRDTRQIRLVDRQYALMLSKTVSDLQKRLGVIEASTSITSLRAISTYNISAAFMNPKVVKYGSDTAILEKKSTEWIDKQTSQSGTPIFYAIKYTSGTAALYLYPTPDKSGDTIIVTSNLNYGLYSPSASTHNFGTFDGNTFSGNLVFPDQYEQALLKGMMKELFPKLKHPDIHGDYEAEIELLKVLQYNGEKFEYHFDEFETDENEGIPTARGSTNVDIDQANKELRFTAVYGGSISVEYTRDWVAAPTVVDDGTKLIITSSGEFTMKTYVTPNSMNVDSYQVAGDETNTIHVNYYGNNYGTITVRIEVF
jgi:hypothetical protein